MRKSILRFGALALVSIMSIGAFAEDFIALDGKGTYTIIKDDGGRGTVSLKTPASGTVPSEVQNSSGKWYDVVAISANAFKDKKTLTISVPSSVKEIGDMAFFITTRDEGVTTTIELADNGLNLKKVGQSAFHNAMFASGHTNLDLSNLDLSKDAPCGNNAFSGSNITSVVWANGLETVPQGAFKSCTSLTTFRIAKGQGQTDNLASVSASAFEGCTALVSFGFKESSAYFLPASLKIIKENAFNGCEVLTGFGFMNSAVPSIKTVGHHAFKNCAAFVNNDFNAFQYIETVESGAFMGCNNTGFTTVTIPTLLEAFSDIDTGTGTGGGHVAAYDGVFQGCTNLTTVNFHSAFNTLGKNAFNGCTSLITLDKFDKTLIVTIPEGAFKGTTAAGGISVTLPAGVTSIERNAFNGSMIKSIAWGQSKVTTIGESAFSGASAFYAGTDLSLPGTLQKIGKEAFKATTFTKVTFPAPMTTIGEKAFAENTSITVITITGQHAVAATQTLADKVSCSDDNAFADVVYSAATLTVPYGCYEMYKDDSKTTGTNPQYNTPTWHKFYKNGETLNDKIITTKASYLTGTPNDKFWVGGLCYEVTKNDGKSLAEVQVVDGRYRKYNAATDVTKAAERNQWGVIPAGIKINEQTKNLKDLDDTDIINGTEIVIPQYVTTRYDGVQGTNAYYKVTGLVNVNTEALVVGDDLTAEGQQIAAIETVTIKAADIAVPAIFNKAGGFTGLKTFQTTDDGSIKSLAQQAFYKSPELSKVDIMTAADFKKIPTQAFSQCKKLTKFVIPETVTEIHTDAFYFTGLEEIILPQSLTNIKGRAFMNTALESINIPASVASIGANAFTFTHDNATGHEKGVKDVYVNWESGEDLSGISADAFGTEQYELVSGRDTYYLRNLHIPAGQYQYYKSNTNTLFTADAHIFDLLEGIKVNEENLYTEIGEDGQQWIELEDNKTESVEILSNLNDVNILYKRNIKDANVRQCWYVPFAVKAGDVPGATFEKLCDTKVDGDNVTIEVKAVAPEETVKANTCYVVSFSEAGSKDIQAKGLKMTAENSYSVSCSSTVFTFQGLYQKETASTATSFYIVNEAGNFQFLGKDKSVYAYRFKMTPSDNPNDPYKVKFVVLDDDDATAIENVKANSLTAPMFDLMGRQIASPAKGQVYIQNGVKKLAK